MKTASDINKKIYNACAYKDIGYLKHRRALVSAVKNILDGIIQTEKLKIADIGCFTGILTERYIDLSKHHVDGFDISINALKKAKLRGINPKIWDINSEKVPADECYDVIIALDVIEHLTNNENFMQETYRILKDDGYLIISTPNLNYWISRILVLFGKVPWVYPGVSFKVRYDRRVVIEHVVLGNMKEWKKLFEEHGYKVEKIVGVVHPFNGGIKEKVLQLIDVILSKRTSLALIHIFLLRKKDMEL